MHTVLFVASLLWGSSLLVLLLAAAAVVVSPRARRHFSGDMASHRRD